VIPSTAETHTPEEHDPDEVLQRYLSSHSAYVNTEMTDTKSNSNLPGTSWADREESYSFTMEELHRFSAGRLQNCPKQVPNWQVLCFC